ncbi:DUF58 domain-containing protein [Shewanella halifaxensis]|uniref:DUF58 domain-containing protein n=1 Tax=Shewanella halifaxensis TaxID=271098 RepID=UPI000D599A69|nr:DUF58 domain-containing protein [Shewanella halifaxensis]
MQKHGDKLTRQTLTVGWNKWLSRRLPASKQVTLSHKSIFILPSGFGLAWLVLVVLLFLLGTNYQNNLIMALSLLLLSVFNTCIIYSYKNLSGLTLTSKQQSSYFAGSPIYYPIQLSSKQQAVEIQCQFKGQPLHTLKTVTAQASQLLVTVNNPHRGVNRPGRLKVESRYPLGLCRAWSQVDLDLSQLVFAKPINDPNPVRFISKPGDDPQTSGKYVTGVDEFKGLKEYQTGEPLKQIAWKQWAQGRGMLTKEFEQPQGAPMWLTLDENSHDIELALSHLAWQTEQLTAHNQVFGLTLSGHSIPPNHGQKHRMQVQTQLALFPRKTPLKAHQ